MKKRNKVIITIATIIILAIVGANIGFNSLEKNIEQLMGASLQDVDLAQLEDGVYLGSHKAFPIEVEVQVTVKQHKIEDIKLLKHTNGKGASAETVPSKVLKAQTLMVDMVSGATYSSKAILKAIEDALSNQAQIQ